MLVNHRRECRARLLVHVVTGGTGETHKRLEPTRDRNRLLVVSMAARKGAQCVSCRGVCLFRAA
jgi:hypothetical protein